MKLFALAIDDPQLQWVIRFGWQTTLLIGVVIGVQWLLRNHLAPRWRYNLWLLVMLRLVMPVSWESPLSLFNLLHTDRLAEAIQPQAGKAMPESGVADPSYTAGQTQAGQEFAGLQKRPQPGGQDDPANTAAGLPITPTLKAGNTTSVANHPFNPASSDSLYPNLGTKRTGLGTWLFYGWLAGVVIFGMYLLIEWQNFWSEVKRANSVTSEAVLRQFEECQRVMGISREVPLLAVAQLKSPAVFGCFHAKILIPQAILRQFAPRELRGIFLHELGHIRRGDTLVNWLALFVQVIHWFNPLVWLAFHRMRGDRELACDALVLSRATEKERDDYGATIIKLLESFLRPYPRPGLIGLLENKQQIKRRIQMIAQFRNLAHWPGVAVAAFGMIALTVMTDAQSEHSTARPQTAPAADRINRETKLQVDDRAILVKRLDEIANTIRKFQEANNIVSPKEMADEAQAQYNKAHDEYLNAQKERKLFEAMNKVILAEKLAVPMGKASPNSLDQPDGQQYNQLKARLKTKQDEWADLQVKLMPSHPKMVMLSNEIHQLQAAIDTLLDKVERGRLAYIAELRIKEKNYEKLLPEFKKDVNKWKAIQQEYSTMKENEASLKSMLSLTNLNKLLADSLSRSAYPWLAGKATFFGAVKGQVSLGDEPKTVTQAMMLLGYNEFANLTTGVILRRTDPKTNKDLEIRVNVKAVIDGNRDADVILQDGDRIEVKEKSIFF